MWLQRKIREEFFFIWALRGQVGPCPPTCWLMFTLFCTKTVRFIYTPGNRDFGVSLTPPKHNLQTHRSSTPTGYTGISSRHFLLMCGFQRYRAHSGASRTQLYDAKHWCQCSLPLMGCTSSFYPCVSLTELYYAKQR